MEKVVVDSIEQLSSYLKKYEKGFLFRGQTTHYSTLPTSFNRHGCVPPLMFKWTHYSKSLIRAFGGGCYHDLDMGMSQAILQHYGWRSFFVDLTKSPQMACWFAANKYGENRRIHMCEDFEENPVWLVHKEASYISTEAKGHVYVVDSKYLVERNIKIHDLTDISGDEGTIRFQTQAACLAEGVAGELPQESIIAHLVVNHEVLVGYYESKGIKSISDVFPSREKDYILRCLLDLPWYEIKTDKVLSIPTYRRSLEIPEYDSSFVKHLSPRITLFSQFWISENRHSKDSVFSKLPFYKISEHAYFANTNKKFDLSEVNKILDEYSGFVIELDGLIKIPELGESIEYEKGILVEKIDSDMVSVSGLVVEHLGRKVNAVGANAGWFYKVIDGVWEKASHSDQCPCNNDLRHELQFSLLRVLNESIKEGKIICENILNYRHKELKVA